MAAPESGGGKDRAVLAPRQKNGWAAGEGRTGSRGEELTDGE